MTKSGFKTTARRMVFGTAFATVLAFGCSDYNSNNNPPYTGAGGFVQCITYRPTGGAAGTATVVDGGNNNDDGGTVACNPNTGNGGTTATTGNGGTTGAGGTGTTRGPRPY